MPAYKAYPKVLATPNRKQRKAKRKAIFEFNSMQASVERKERRLKRKQEKVNG